MRAVFLALALLLIGTPTFAQPLPIARPGFDGIFEAFQTRPLVGLGETHRRAQEIDFYTALIRDPRFARDDGNVVVEFGGAAHQDIIDRYIAGEDVPYQELRKVWTDTVGWIGVVPSMSYQLFYYQVRQVNLTLPAQDRIHVWLGEPVIDWSQVKTHADWVKVERLRDSHPAELIEREILGHGKKALVIYGGAHFWPLMPGDLGKKLEDADWHTNTLRARIDQNHPGALFTVRFYTGAGDKACMEGSGPDIDRLGAGRILNALAQLHGGLVGESQGQDTAGRNAVFDQRDNTSGQAPGQPTALARMPGDYWAPKPLGKRQGLAAFATPSLALSF